MTIAKQLVQFAVLPLAMAAGVALCLWVLLGVLHIERLSYPAKPQRAPAEQKVAELETEAVRGPTVLSIPTVLQIQAALVRNGYSIGPAGSDGIFNEDTLSALLAFQDNNALPVQPTCDRQCLTALGEPGPEAGAAK